MNKLYVNRPNHEFLYIAKIAADYTNTPVQVVIVNEEMAQDAAFKAKKAHGAFPMLETPEGTIIFESHAIATYFARAANCTDLLGASAFEEAQVNQWLSIASMNVFPAIVKIVYTAFGMKFDMPAFNDGCKSIKEQCKMLNTFLASNDWLAAGRLTLADISMFVALSNAFIFVLDAGFRKAMPNVTAWFTKMSNLPCIVRNMGYVKMCDKPFKPVDASKCVAVPVSEKKVEAAPAKKADDDFDPFADDDDEEDAEAAKAALKKKAEEAKGKKEKAKPIAKSILVWEVKPYSAETDLDALAKKIISHEIDGLVWKTEYKKEPVAFGVFKLNIGAVIEDAKVSSDDVQEMMENLCGDEKLVKGEDDDSDFDDRDYLVQSVEILVFNKL